MQWRTSAKDCLYVNWALPAEAAPAPPAPLRYERHPTDEGDVVFLSALFFRFEDLRPVGLPLPAVSFPQLSLRLYVLDRQGVPSVLFVRLLMPWWAVPGSRWMGRQPARAAHLDFGRPSAEPDRDGWFWRVRAPEELRVLGRPGGGMSGHGPALGGWSRTVGYFRDRSRSYAPDEKRLRELSADEASTEPVPFDVRVDAADLLRRTFPAVPAEVWQAPHSSWLCPEIPVVLQLGDLRRAPLVPSLSAPGS